jgi:hypothetical protein
MQAGIVALVVLGAALFMFWETCTLVPSPVAGTVVSCTWLAWARLR